MPFDVDAFLAQDEFDVDAFLNDAPTVSPANLINSESAIQASIPVKDPPLFSSVNQAIKHRTNAAYVSTISGLSADSITPDLYPHIAKEAGLSGNPEADFELIRNKTRRTSLFANGEDSLDELLTRDRKNKTNTFLRSFITNGIRSLDETVTRGLKKLSGKLADINPYLTQQQNALKSEIEILNKRIDQKRVGESYVIADDPDVIALRQAKIQLDAINDTRKANQRQGLFYEMLEESEAAIRAGRVFEASATLATDEEFDKTLTSQFINGMGSFAYSMSSFAIGGPIVGFTANTGAIYQGTIDDARQSGATEQEAFDAGILSLPAATLDAVIDKVLFTKLLKPLKGKMTVGELFKNVATSISSGALSEGAEQLWQNVNAVYLSAYDPDRPLDDGVLASIAMGAIFGGAPAATSVMQFVPGFGTIRTSDPTPEEWKLIRKFETDEQILKNRGGQIALDAANGDTAAQELHKKLVTSTEDVGDQPFGPLREEPDLTRAEMDALEGRVLNQLNDEQTDTPLVSDEDLAVLDLNEEADLVARDTEGRADEDTTELLPAERKLVNLELEQELSALDEELAANAPALADENLSKAAKELAELELAETEGIVNKDLTKEQQERLAAGQDVDLSPSTQIDKKTAKFLAQIVKVENKLNAKIAKLKKQITKNRTDAKAAKLEALGKLQERIRKIRSLAALSKREALKRAGEKASERLAKEVQKRLNIVKNNIQDRKNLVQSIKQLKQLIDQLPRSIRGDLNALFPKVSTKVSQEAQLKVLREAVSRIEAKIEGYVKVEQRKRLTKVIKRGVAQAKTRGAELNIFKRIDEISKMSRSEAFAVSNALMQKEELTPEEVVTVYLHDTFGGALKADSEINSLELRQSAREAERILRTGKLLIAERLEARSIRDRENVQEAQDAILGGEKPLNQRQQKTKRDKNKSVLGNFLRGISDFDTRIQSYEWLLDKLTRTGKDLKGPLQKYHKAVVKAGNRSYAETESATQRAQTALSQIFKTKSKSDLLKILEEWQTGKDFSETGIYFFTPGKAIEQDFSKMEAVSLWMQWKDKSLANTFEKMGVNQSTINQVEKFIGDEGKAIGEFLLSEYGAQFGRINAVHRDVEGFDLRAVENYSPISREVDPEPHEEGYKEFIQPIATARNANLQARTNNTHSLKFQDALANYVQHVAKMEHYISHAHIARDLRVVFQNTKVKNAITQTQGNAAYNTLKRFNDDIINGGIAQVLKYQILDKIRTGLTKSSLSLKPAILVKQLTSIPAYADAMPAVKWTKGFASFMANPSDMKRKVDILRTSEYIQQRISEGYERDVADAVKGFEQNKLVRMESLTSKAMFLTRWGDIMAVYAGGWPVYDHYRNQAIAEGKSESEAHEIGIEHFEAATKRTQQSSRPEDLATDQRASWSKLFTMYMTAPASYYRMEVAAFRNLAKGRLTKKEFAKRIFIFHFLLPNLFQAAGSAFFVGAFGDDADLDELLYRQMRASLVGSLNGILFAGDALETIIDKLAGGESSWAQSIPLLEFLTELSSGIGDFPKTLKKEGLIAALDDGVQPFMEAAGIPYQQIETWIRTTFEKDDLDDKIFKFLGWSDYALAETDK